MSISHYFKGSSGRLFWINIVAVLVFLSLVPVVGFYLLDIWSHHGEKIEVPSVISKNVDDAADALYDAELRYVIADSTYDATAPAGSVLEQTPKAGALVKSGRKVFLTINLNGEPMVCFPDLVGNSSLREAEAQLKALGFKLSPCERVENEPRDFVVGIKQGLRMLNAGEMVSRDRALTIMAGAGESDSLELDSTIYDSPIYDTDDYE